jgi:hypothetical protein
VHTPQGRIFLKSLIPTLTVMRFHYCDKKCLQLDHIPNQKNPVYILTLFLCDQVQHYPPGNAQALTVLSFLLMLLYLLIISHICSLCPIHLIVLDVVTNNKGKGKAVPLQAWSGPEGSRKLRFPDYTTTAQDGGEVVSPTHWPPLPPGNAPGTHFC